MNKLLILYTTFSQKNYYLYKLLPINKLLCGQNKSTILTPNNYYLIHYISLEYFTHFFKTTIILLSNYYFGNRKGLLDHIQTKKYF